MSRVIAFILFILTLPIYPILYILIKTSSPGPFIFKQKRVGRNKKRFTLFKFRTMIENAENLKDKYKVLNESDGPVFKVRNDPRFTKIGKLLSRLGFDELPQLINIIKGEMAFVGPRPLPINEVKNIPMKYEKRFSILPGLTSPWVTSGSHSLTFEKWMRLDVKYLKDKNIFYDLYIIAKTLFILIREVYNYAKKVAHRYVPYIFSFLILLPLIYEGLGLNHSHKFSFILIISLPSILFFRLFKDNKNILIPTNLSISFLIFTILAAFSTLSAANIQRSFEYLIFLIAVFLIFIYSYNKKSEIKSILIPSIIGLSLLFSLYSLVLLFNFFPFIKIPEDGYQFVYAKFGSHNHLGDFLVLPFVISLFFIYQKTNIRYFLRNIIVFSPFIFFSYSRSAYLSLLVSTFLIHVNSIRYKRSIKFRLITPLFIALAISAFLFLLIVTTKVASFTEINLLLTNQFGLSIHKEFTANRLEYILQGFESIIENPLFGNGLDNFIYASRKYTTNPLYGLSYSSHNLLMDVLVNLGIVGFIVIIHMTYRILQKSDKNVLIFVLVSIFVIFLTDYVFNIYSFFLLFFVIIASIYNESYRKVKTLYFLIPSLILLSFATNIILGNFLYTKKMFFISFLIYPLNQKVYEPLINSIIAKKGTTQPYLLIYENLYHDDPAVLEFLGNYYEKNENPKRSLSYFEQALQQDLFNYPHLIPKVYDLKIKHESVKKAREFGETTINKVKTVKKSYYFSEYFKQTLEDSCQKYSWNCPNLSDN